MADNNHQPAELPGATPAQPSVAHQPAEQTPYAQYSSSYGQPYQPYQQYGQTQQQQYGYVQPQGAYPQGAYTQGQYPQAVPRPVVPESKGWVNSKNGLHALAVVLSIICLGMGLSFVSTSQSYLAAVACPVPVMALVWSAAELIVRAVHKWQRGIHPGGQVAACLILWLAAAIVGALQGGLAGFSRNHCDYYYTNGGEYHDDGGCYDSLGGKKALWTGVAAITCILWLIYFALFIGACIDTSKHNAAKRLVMVVNPATYWGPPAQGWQPMPDQPSAPQQQQQGQYMPVPQPAMTHTAGAGQDIPLQDRTPSPMTGNETPNEKGQAAHGSQQQQGGHQVHEFYGGAN